MVVVIIKRQGFALSIRLRGPESLGLWVQQVFVRIQNLCVRMFILETMKKIETGKVVLTKEGESGRNSFSPKASSCVWSPVGCFRNRAYDDEFV